MNVVIREYKDSDNLSLNKVLKESFNLEKKGNNNNSNIELVAVHNNIVVGYLVINKVFDSLKNNYYALINYVCVKEEYRNNKIGSNLLQKAIDICNEENIIYIELTSNKNRVEAQHLYKKYDFIIRDTDVFRKELI